MESIASNVFEKSIFLWIYVSNVFLLLLFRTGKELSLEAHKEEG